MSPNGLRIGLVHFVAFVAFVALAGCGGLRERPLTAGDGGPVGAAGSSAGAGGHGGAGGSVGGSGAGGPVDGGGDAPSCVAGGACVPPANPCHKGTFVCTDGGVMTCMELSDLQANGTSCDTDKVCHNGSCDSCVADMPCDVTGRPCRVGSIVCTTGAPVCTETDNKPNGTMCSAGMVCQGGSCATCQSGASCQPTNKCHNGTLTCSPSIGCTDANTNVAAGVACGTDMVCDGRGTCTACMVGADCVVPGKPCSKGTTACNTGAPVCIESGNAPNGTACGDNMVCGNGACAPCSAGSACVPANSCHGGITVCTPNISCTDTGNSLANGTGCAPGKVCNAGTCVACPQGDSCQPANMCRTGVITCVTGSPVCSETGNQPNGAGCGGTNMVCNAGGCVACGGGSCVPTSNPCHTGTLNCSSGTPTCSDTGANASDGTGCGMNLVCKTGMCMSCMMAVACQPANACKTGLTSCTTGTSMCVESGNKGAGTLCGAAQSCANGVLTLQGTCNASGTCTPATMQCPNGCNTAGTDCATCPTGQTSCPMGCRDLMHDPMNCGQCDNICPAPAANTGIPVCISSMCNVQCNTGYLACDPSQAICQRTLWDFEDATLEGWKILATPTAAGKPMVNNAGGHSGKFSLLVPLDATGQMRQFDAGPLICAGKGVSKVVSTVIAWVALVPSGTPSAPGRGSYIGLRITSESGDTLTKINVPAYNEWFQLKAPLPAGDVQLLQFAVEGLLAPPDIITVNPDWTGAIYIDDVQIQ